MKFNKKYFPILMVFAAVVVPFFGAIGVGQWVQDGETARMEQRLQILQLREVNAALTVKLKDATAKLGVIQATTDKVVMSSQKLVNATNTSLGKCQQAVAILEDTVRNMVDENYQAALPQLPPMPPPVELKVFIEPKKPRYEAPSHIQPLVKPENVIRYAAVD